jgi:hypothetical protein
MAIGPEKVEPIKPVSEEVAKPVAAPNYVGMYSEAIKGALAPYDYLLNYRKELSEEDERRAQIQNFLDEHDLKSQELAETHREHVADEAQKRLDNLMQGKKLDEDIRHNQADEATADLEAQIKGKTAQTEADRAAEEERKDKDESNRLWWAQEETNRENRAKDQRDQNDQDLKAKTDAAQISKDNADSLYLQRNADKLKQDSDDRTNDYQVMDELNQFLNHQRPEDIYASRDNPEIQQAIDDARGRLKTTEGRHMWDERVGKDTALGMELDERGKLSRMSPEGKKAFSDAYIKTPSNMQPQERFNTAMQAANVAEGRYFLKQDWLDEGNKAYKEAITQNKSPDDAFVAGQTADVAQKSGIKQKEETKVDKAFLEMVKDSVKKLPSEIQDKTNGEDAYDQRANSIATRIGSLYMQGKKDEFNAAMDELHKTGNYTGQGGAAVVNPADKAKAAQDWVNKHGLGLPTSGSQSGAPSAVNQPIQLASVTPDTTHTTSGGFVLPGMSRDFQNAIDTSGVSMANLGSEQSDQGEEEVT